MKRCKRALALLLALGLALSLSACSKAELRAWAEETVIDLVTKMGLRTTEGGDEEAADLREATPGGQVVFPEGVDFGATHLVTDLRDGVLYVGFNNISNRSTPYFVAAGDSVTLTAYAAPSATVSNLAYKAALWELTEDQSATTYVPDSTIYFSADGDQVCGTATVSGLTPGRRYKITISYDSKAYITGGMTVSGVTDDALTSIEG